MELREAIEKRASVRFYTEEEVDEKDLLDILNAGLAAPSGVNLQPWYFVAIRSPEEMLRMRDVMKKVAEEIEPSLKERFANHPSVVADTVKFVGGMGNAPACILAFQYKDYEGQDESQIHQSIAAALENMCLVAVEKGMGTCWLTGAVEAGYGEKLRETYAPNQGKMVAMLTLGYPAREAKSPRRKEGRFVIL